MKTSFIISVLFVTLFSINSVAAVSTYRYEATSPEIMKRDSIINYAQEHVGIPYKWGGTTSSGFDCTGFVYFVFKKFGIKVSRASSGYENTGEKVGIDVAQPGDIMLFTGTNSSIRKVGHAGIVLKNDKGNVDFIHSSSSKKHFGVTITRYNESGYMKRFLRVITVL